MKYSPTIIDDFVCYAPHLLKDSSHFPTENFKDLYSLEQGHFWFESRNKIIIHLMDKYLHDLHRPEVLEIGCGTGFVLENISRSHPHYSLSGSELYLEGLRFARMRVPHTHFFQADARDLPFKEKYDVIGAFDVVEHIEEDMDVLLSLHSSLKPKGFLFLTVPQHMWLWSAQDEMACHKRRYTRKEMTDKLEACGFSVIYITSFVFILLPLMYLSRKKKQHTHNLDEFTLSNFLNKMLSYIMIIDETAIKLGVSLPVGGSLCCIAQKT